MRMRTCLLLFVMLFSVLTAMVTSMLAQPIGAAECATLLRGRGSTVDRRLAIVPFAIPVATPVAVVNSGGVLYAAGGPPVASATTSSELDADELADFRAWRAAKVARSTLPSSAVNEHCGRCHSGATPKGSFNLTGSSSAEVRLRAIDAALHGEMPPGNPLSTDELTRLLQELSKVPGKGN